MYRKNACNNIKKNHKLNRITEFYPDIVLKFVRINKLNNTLKYMENKSVVSKILSGYKIPDKTVPDKTGLTVSAKIELSNRISTKISQMI